MYCMHCGTKLPAEANFCWKCGRPPRPDNEAASEAPGEDAVELDTQEQARRAELIGSLQSLASFFSEELRGPDRREYWAGESMAENDHFQEFFSVDDWEFVMAMKTARNTPYTLQIAIGTEEEAIHSLAKDPERIAALTDQFLDSERDAIDDMQEEDSEAGEDQDYEPDAGPYGGAYSWYDDSDQRARALGAAGAGILFLGVFAPIVHIPLAGDLNYFQNGHGDGIFIIALAILSFLFVFSGKSRWLILTGLASLAVLIFTFFAFQSMLSQARSQLDSQLADNPFKGLGDLTLQSIQLQWGWAVLLVGALVVVGAGVSTSQSTQ